MLEDEFKSFLKEYKNSAILFCTHKRADIDAIVSAYVLSTLFPKSKICVPDECNYSATRLAEKFGIEWHTPESLNVDEFEGIVAVDTSSYILLPLAKEKKVIAVIDHHEVSESTFRGKYNIVDEKAFSSAEIVYRVFPHEKLTDRLRYLLGVAVIGDTYRFKSAGREVFEHMSKLMRGFRYSDMLGDAFPNRPLDEKKAILSGLKRLDYVVIDSHVIAFSVVSMKEGDLASILSEVADISVCAKKVDEGTRISARSSHTCSVPLNEIMNEVGRRGKGGGGGHKHAAGAFVRLEPDKAIDLCISVIKEFFASHRF